MNKSTKGALAAAAAGVLLLGGAGTLAYWSDSGTAALGSIRTGSLTLENGACSGWKHASAPEAADVDLIVPGDQVTKTCTFLVGATGDNLSATLSASPAPITYTPSKAADTLSLQVDEEYLVDGVATRTVTSADDTRNVTATITVTFPYGSGTVNAQDTQDLTATLDDITVSLTQSNPSA